MRGKRGEVVGFFVAALFSVSLALDSVIAKENGVGMSVGVIFGLSSTLSACTPALMGYVADRVGLRRAFSLLVAFAFVAALLALALPKQTAASAEAAMVRKQP